MTRKVHVILLAVLAAVMLVVVSVVLTVNVMLALRTTSPLPAGVRAEKFNSFERPLLGRDGGVILDGRVTGVMHDDRRYIYGTYEQWMYDRAIRDWVLSTSGYFVVDTKPQTAECSTFETFGEARNYLKSVGAVWQPVVWPGVF